MSADRGRSWRADTGLELAPGTPPEVADRLERLFEEFVELDLHVWRFRESLLRTVQQLRWR